MSVLLDTHIFYWLATGYARLSASHRQLIEDRREPVYVSAVTAWEIAIKVKLGKWPEAAPLLPNLAAAVEGAGPQALDVTLLQAELAGSLELVHKDPFDRLLAAQAISLDIPIATVDPALALLGCKTV